MKFHLTLWIQTLALVLLAVSAVAEEPIRMWTSTDGKAIQAQLESYDGKTVSLRMNGKTFDVKKERLSEADHSYLAAYTERLKKEHAERSAKIKRGSFVLPIDQRMFPQPEDFYDSMIGKASFKAVKKEAQDPLAQVTPIAGEEKAQVYVPADYDGEKAFGIYLHISPGDGPNMPDYQSVMDENAMIMASPFKGGNKEESMRRIMLALDTVATLKKEYRIDDSRIFVGGMSGGGITAMQAQLLHPDVWAGTLSHARGMNLGPYGDYYSETETFDQQEFRRMSKMKQRVAILSGPKDSNYEHCKRTEKEWKAEGYDVRFFDVPAMGHNNAPKEDFENALKWVMQVKR